ncbi:MAG TPA: nucleotide sugar dehydrogenase [Candidatus Limnocylindria bacterium]
MTSVSIFGLGYVGSVSAACLADGGFDVIGVDVSPVKVDMITAGRSPIVEEGLDDLVAKAVASGRLRATTDPVQAVHDSDVSIICVGTPSNPNGSLDLTAVQRVAETIGLALRDKETWHTVVVRSTMLPGSTDERVIPALERHSGKKAGEDFGVGYNPEFLREGTSLRDFYDPPFTVIGCQEPQTAEVIAGLYANVPGDVIRAPLRVAEMVKYACNAYHALKVSFANEIGQLAKAQGVDSHQVMDIFTRDRKLNISSAYLRPGFAFGGSCLPKDLRAMLHEGKRNDLTLPVLEAILPSNQLQIERAFDLVRATGAKRIGVLGLSFKAGTDDLRESPLVALVERLIGRGYHVTVYDENVSFANIHGANRAYIEREIPHIVSIMTDSLDDLVSGSEVVIIGNADAQFTDALARDGANRHVIDLVRVGDGLRDAEGYEGIAW